MSGSRAPHLGYSLIELLIFIGIIGILASMVLVASFASRNKATDARIRNDIAQLRWQAEIIYDTQQGRFTNWSTHPSVVDNVNLILNDLTDAYGGVDQTQIQDSDHSTYCVSTPLVSDAGKHYCIDANGVFEEVTSPCPATAPFECPV